MKTKLVAAALLAATAFVSAPVFASGFGPAPYYNPIAGAPASERGPAATTAQGGDTGATSYGGVASGTSQTGSGGLFHKHNTGANSCVGPVSYCNIYFGS
ncbi:MULTISPECIES: hypothetical protein [Paraburkholderia]|jgi:hypothetical protein|uniref:Uncharacterized protein n=2 Tax=Paraburkholderia TaxID=1822464 RepID=A0AAJ4VP73_9BURK|nr:hypothetical protein [Paraburkholderia hospita]SKC98189.1 hypothetical protein SAMN05445504_7349 [Burkholderia sp. CF099]SOE83293.1 hypothetical protein SAMN05446935_3695 [Burkholderia sp. YR290]AUT73545.1 hypothetical protein C2L64_34875 [Paraburkholderia hospita]AXF03205.1 hypothetical protein CUJ88_32095 [Paraburkholderia hospita]EIM99039.1 hypothetical protein WQE_21726 [Paraburkholderia hospita]